MELKLDMFIITQSISNNFRKPDLGMKLLRRTFLIGQGWPVFSRGIRPAINSLSGRRVGSASNNKLGFLSAAVFLQFLQKKLPHYNYQVYNKVLGLIRSGLYEFCPIVQVREENLLKLATPFTHLKPVNAIDAILLEAFATILASAAGFEMQDLSTFLCSRERHLADEVQKWADIGSVIVLDVFPSFFQDRDNEDLKDFIFSYDWTEAMPLYNLLESFFESHFPLSDKEQVDLPLVPYLGPVLVDSYMEKQIFRPFKDEWFAERDPAIKVTRSFTDIVIGFPSSYSLDDAASLIITEKFRLDSTREYEIEKAGSAPIFNYRAKEGGSKILLSNGKVLVSNASQ